jgi:membrane fusion protein (multidrug efflux system)
MDSFSWRRALGKALALALVVTLAGALATGCQRGGEGAEGDDPEAESGESAEQDEGAGDGEEGENGEDEEEDAVPVQTAELARGRIESVLRFSTNLEAESQVQVLAESTREIERLLVEEGDVVSRGQLLIQLEDDEQRTELARIESQLAREQRELARQENLFQQKLISEQEFTDARYEVEQLELAKSDAQRELSYTEVRAPISGTVTQRLVKVGDYITVNQHLFDIIDFNSIVARVYVPEKELVRLRQGQMARITAQALGDEERFGAIDRIAPVVDSRSGTVKVTVAIPPSEGLLPGMYVSVDLVTEVHEDALLVPKRALVYDDDQLFVFRVTEDEHVERLMLTPVLEDRDHIEPAGVLDDGDRIVIAGQAGLKDGSLVREVRAQAGVPEEETDADVASEDEEASS